MQVLVAEPSAPIANALKKFLDGSAEVQVVHFLDEAVQVVRARPPDVLVCSVSEAFDGEVLCQQVRKLGAELGVVLVYPPADFEQAPRRAHEAGADGFLVGPLKRHNVLSATRAAWRLKVVQKRAAKAEAEIRSQSQALAALQLRLEKAEKKAGLGGALAIRQAGGVNTTDEAFFKKFMLIEVKRSRRYQYPVAVLLVALDKQAEALAVAAQPDAQRAAVRAEALGLIAGLLRDVDLAMPFADDKYLVFLPHTHRSGSLVVARRLLERMRRLSSLPDGSASVGVASFDPKVEPRPQVSFGGLVREAAERLKRAQEAGGNRLEVPETVALVDDAPASPAEARPRKNRISMG